MGTDEHMINVHHNFVLFLICHCVSDAYSFSSPGIPVVFLKVNRWHVNALGVDEHIINGHYNFVYFLFFICHYPFGICFFSFFFFFFFCHFFFNSLHDYDLHTSVKTFILVGIYVFERQKVLRFEFFFK